MSVLFWWTWPKLWDLTMRIWSLKTVWELSLAFFPNVTKSIWLVKIWGDWRSVCGNHPTVFSVLCICRVHCSALYTKTIWKLKLHVVHQSVLCFFLCRFMFPWISTRADDNSIRYLSSPALRWWRVSRMKYWAIDLRIPLNYICVYLILRLKK